jgi:hypothetical protein
LTKPGAIAGWNLELEEAVSAVMPASGATTAQTMRWFQNVKSGTAFDTGEQPLEYRLQLSLGIQRFHQAHPTWTIHAATTNVAAPKIKKKVYPVRRGSGAPTLDRFETFAAHRARYFFFDK